MTINTGGFNGYSLDSHRKIHMFDLVWLDSFSFIFLQPKALKRTECLKIVQEILTALASTTAKGFLTVVDLSTYPVIAEILPAFIQGPGTSFVKGEKSMESYK